jgi:hypothetical protein
MLEAELAKLGDSWRQDASPLRFSEPQIECKMSITIEALTCGQSYGTAYLQREALHRQVWYRRSVQITGTECPRSPFAVPILILDFPPPLVYLDHANHECLQGAVSKDL